MPYQPGPVLQIDHLSVRLTARGGDGFVHAVNDVSLTLDRGRALGIIGESGCGKSMTAMAVMRLLPPAGTVSAGAIQFNGDNLLSLSETQMRTIRGRSIAMILQDPMVSLDPLFPVGKQIVEALAAHNIGGNTRERRGRAIDLLRSVGIPSPEIRIDQLPHEMSGGMLQRVVIAIAIACEPELLIADEPTTALDPTIQRQILELLGELRRRHRLSIILVTHDFGVASAICDDLVVMYAGSVVEAAEAPAVFDAPLHPYTRALMASASSQMLDGRLQTIEGQPPDLRLLSAGCSFAPRCALASDICRNERPPLTQIANHQVACWHAETV